MKQTTIYETEISYGSTAAQVKRWIANVPDHARISTRHVPGDRPFDSSQDFIRASWVKELD